MAEGNRLAFTKRVSLEGVQEGWTHDCYVLVTLASSFERSDVQDFAKEEHTNREATEKMVRQVQDHFVAGKGMALGSGEELQLVDLTTDHLETFPDAVLYDVWAAVNGFALDPKDIETATADSSAQQPVSDEPETSESTTATSSSME